VDYRLLGPLEVYDADRQVLVGGPRVRALLAVLLVEANRVVTTDRLAEALWADQPPASARRSLHFLVHRLRRTLPGDGQAVRTSGGGYLLQVGQGELDADRFEGLLAQARAAWVAGDAEAASAGFEAALALWRGRPLGEFAEAEFARTAVARLDELRVAALTDQVDVELARGRHAELLGRLQALLSAHPLHERFHAQRILALYRSGRGADALDACRAARRAFADELGLEPGPELRRLEQAVLDRAPWLAAPARAGGSADGRPAPAPAPAPAREERKVVTVLVAMLVEAGGPGGPADPEDARARAAAGLALVERQVARFGGQVQAIVGGTAVAVFGVPTVHDDDPERAVRAALELAGAAGSATPASFGERPDGPRFAAGVDTGEVLVTTGGGTRPAPAGEVLDRASALAAAARPGQVLVGPATELATRRVVDHEAVREADGAEPTAPARWVAVRPRGRTGAADRLTVSSSLLEREQELAVLRSLLGRARWGREPQLVTLVGPAGIGKSRLLYELGELVEADPDLVTWRQGRSLPYGEGVTFWALGEIVKAHAGILDSDGAEAAEAKLGRAVADAIDEPADAAWVARRLAPLVRVGAGAASRAIVPEGDQAESFAAWRLLLEAMAAERPLVLVFEDLQWADDALLDFVDGLVDGIAPVPLLVVCAARSELLERRPGWGGGKRNATTITLPPLSPEATAALLDELAGTDAVPTSTRSTLVDAAGGNPLFVEEYAHMLRDRDPATAAAAGAGLAVPATVQQVLTARLDALEEADRRLVQDAAVLGEVGWVGALAAVAGVGRAEVEAWLERMERRELARRTRWSSVAGETEFAVRHVLVRDVAYGQLPRAERIDRHKRSAAWLEALGGDRAEGRAELCAHHYRQALSLARAAGQDTSELAERARLALRQAAERAKALNAWTSAAELYAAALELWPAAGSLDDPAAAARPELLLHLGEARFFGEFGGREELLAASEALQAAGDPGSAGAAHMMLAFLAWWSGDTAARDLHGQQAFMLVFAEPPSPGKAFVLGGVSGRLMISDEPEQALAAGQAALETARALGLRDQEAIALTAIGMARVRAGDPGGLADQEASVAMLEDMRSSYAPAFCAYLAASLSWSGDVRAAWAALERGDADAARFGSRGFYDLYLKGMWAMAGWLLGRWSDAVRMAEQVLASPRRHYMQAPCHVVRGRIRLASGDLPGALEDAAGAVAVASEAGDSAVLQPALSFQAAALAAAGRADEAAALGDRLVATLAAGFVHADAGTDFGLAMRRAGQTAARLDGGVQTPSLEAARAVVAGDWAAAAARYDRIGSRPDEAVSRMLAAEALVADGDAAGAKAELLAAGTFWAEVGASAQLERVEALLATAGTQVEELSGDR
jgi:DNA-binding SARP family transcriptional activator